MAPPRRWAGSSGRDRLEGHAGYDGGYNQAQGPGPEMRGGHGIPLSKSLKDTQRGYSFNSMLRKTDLAAFLGGHRSGAVPGTKYSTWLQENHVGCTSRFCRDLVRAVSSPRPIPDKCSVLQQKDQIKPVEISISIPVAVGPTRIAVDGVLVLCGLQYRHEV